MLPATCSWAAVKLQRPEHINTCIDTKHSNGELRIPIASLWSVSSGIGTRIWSLDGGLEASCAQASDVHDRKARKRGVPSRSDHICLSDPGKVLAHKFAWEGWKPLPSSLFPFTPAAAAAIAVSMEGKFTLISFFIAAKSPPLDRRVESSRSSRLPIPRSFPPGQHHSPPYMLASAGHVVYRIVFARIPVPLRLHTRFTLVFAFPCPGHITSLVGLPTRQLYGIPFPPASRRFPPIATIWHFVRWFL